MSKIFLAPHFDDEVLFGCFHLLANPGMHVCVTTPPSDATEAILRCGETAKAMRLLGIDWFTYVDAGVEKNIKLDTLKVEFEYLRERYDIAYAPYYEYDGSEDHNYVSILADKVWGIENVVHYGTYSWPNGKTRLNEIIPEPEWIRKKLIALACYKSQIERESTVAHFLGDLREYREWNDTI